jgi:hypothetical protein
VHCRYGRPAVRHRDHLRHHHNWERTIAIAGCVLSLALVAWAALTRPDAVAGGGAERSAGVPPCSTVPQTLDASGPVSCRTRSATLLIAGPSGTVPVGPVRVRIADQDVRDGSLRLRLRVVGRPFDAARQTYLVVGGRRIRGTAGAEPRTDVAYALTRADRARLARGQADLAVRSPRTAVIGVIRVRGRAGATAS